MLYAKPWERPSAVATLSIVILLSARINSSTRCTVASVAISTGQPGWASSATLERAWENLCTQLWTALHYKHHRKQKHYYEYPLHWVLLPTKMYNRTLLFGSILLWYGRHFDYWHQPLNMRMCVCYLDTWNWTVLLPSDTHREAITSITTVLLPSVTCLLTLPRS
jgi:hypothetical protein